MRKRKFQSVFRITMAVVMCVSSLFPTVPLRAESADLAAADQSSLQKAVGYDSIHGFANEPLYDTAGEEVMAFGGEIHQAEEDGVKKWYWFGEDMYSDPAEGGNTVQALHLYSSTDLYNWTREEDIFKGMTSKDQFETDEYFKNLYGDLSDSEKDTVFDCLKECPTAHPKIFYHKQKQQYVMWVPRGPEMVGTPGTPGTPGTFRERGQCIATSDSIKGPFKVIKYCEDVTGFITAYQESDGTVYIVYQDQTSGGLCMAQLADDYMDIDAGTKRQMAFTDTNVLSSAQGGIFKQNGKYYMVNSAEKQYAVTDSLENGTWTVHNLMIRDDQGQTSEIGNGTLPLHPTSFILQVNTVEGTVYVNITDSEGEDLVNPCKRYVWLPIDFSEDGTIALKKSSNWKLPALSDTEEPDVPEAYDSILGLADKPLYDAKGQEVVACGGEVHQVDENGVKKWYWFGEDAPSDFVEGGNTARGLHLYSSTDLYNWTREEDIFKGMTSKDQFETDEYFKNLYGDLAAGDKDIVFECLKDLPTAHPKVFYDKQNRQYVMWVSGMKGQCIATSDSIKGPFKFVKYCEAVSGFISPFQESDGTVYIVYQDQKQASDNLYMAQLNNDYMDIDKNTVRKFEFTGANAFSAEGAIFKQDDSYYMVNSAQKQYAVTDSLYSGTWTVHDLKMRDDQGQTSEIGEGTLPLNPTSAILQVNTVEGVVTINVTDSWDFENPGKVRYVWLPIDFSEDGTIALKKLSNWKLPALSDDQDPDVPKAYDSIDGLSGEVLYDTDGRRVMACGGEVHQVEEEGKTKWYWFGVNDLEEDGQKKNPGIHLYSSEDLYNWNYEGRMEGWEIKDNFLIAHPKVLYNEQKQQYVMWGELQASGMQVAVSNSIKGPFKIVENAGADNIFGFINLYKESDGTAYIIYGHRYGMGLTGNVPGTTIDDNIYIAQLSSDYTRVQGQPQKVEYTDNSDSTLFASEGGIFKENGKYYIVNAGNPDKDGPQYAVADSINGPWAVHTIGMWDDANQQMVDIDKKNQTSNVFHVKTQTIDKYICVGDSVNGEDPKNVRYIWLPVKFFGDGKIALEQLSNWKLEQENKDIEVTEVKLPETSKTLKIGEFYQINAEVLPSDATDKTLTYESSKDTVATVTGSGKVEAKKAGTANITVKSSNGKTASLLVKVEEGKVVAVTEVKLPETSKTLKIGESYQINAEVLPSDATDKTLTYESSDDTVATVTESGKVEAKKAGTANITVKSSNGKTALLQVKVEEGKVVAVTEVKLPETSKTLKIGEFYQINAEVLPSDATDKTLTYESSDDTVATVTESGKVEAKKAGTANITVKSSNGKTALLQVKVEEGKVVAVTEVKLPETSKTLKIGESYQINAEVLPSDATDKALTYESSDDTVATVTESGKVEAKKAGTANITVKSSNGKTALLQVKVEEEGENTVEVTEVRLSETAKTLKIGESYQINAEVLPTNATNKALTYESSDDTVATVTESGKVEAKKAGTADITVKSSNGKTALLQVKVEKKVEKNEVQKVLVSAKKMTVGIGEKVQIEAAVYPKNASNKALTYKPSNNKVKVDKKGRMTAQKTGSCKITISSSNNKKVVVNVTVKKKPAKISLNAKKKTLKVGKKFQIKRKLPKGTASYKITYVSNKKSVAAVSKTGKVTAKKKGDAVITVKTYNGKKATLKIHVK